MHDLDPPKPAELTETWSPEWAPHVVLRYAKREVGDQGFPKPQPFEVTCSRCSQKWASLCTSGAVRQHAASFATKHVHSDPMLAPKVQRPGSFRKKSGDPGYE